MDAALIPVWVTALGAVVGVVYAIWRNGRSAQKHNEKMQHELKSELAAIKKQLDDPDNGLSAIKRSMDAMQLHCASTSTKLSSQTDTNTNEIAALRKKVG